MKYDAQVNDIKRHLSGAKNILIALSAQADSDTLAAGLALNLSLKQAQKEVSIVSEAQILVGHSHLFAVGDIQNTLPAAKSGNYVITLGGVADNGTAPALQRLDYNTSGNDLNLIFHVLPGQRFEPTFVNPHYLGGGYDLVFVLGAASLENLGSIYTNNQQSFQNVPLINIGKNGSNSLYGTVNLVDGNSSSISEILATALFDLQLPVDGDMSTNILNGVYSATNGLQSGNIGPDTFMVISECLRRGGQRPGQVAPQQVQQPQPAPAQPMPDFGQLFGVPSQPAPQPAPQPVPQPVAQPAQPQGGAHHESQPEYQPSPEEATQGEGVASGEQVLNPEPDWLTPKVFRGGNIG